MKIEDAGLAYVLGFGAGLADLCFLIAGVGAWLPPEDSEGPRAHFTFTPELRLGHANKWVAAEARLAQNRKLRLLPPLLGWPRSDAHSSLSR